MVADAHRHVGDVGQRNARFGDAGSPLRAAEAGKAQFDEPRKE
jgi:hypothetical protein